MPFRRSIRKQIRERRSKLPISDHEVFSLRACKHIAKSATYIDAEHIALYVAHNGELDPKHLLTQALADNKKCYLPVLDNATGNTLLFLRYRPGDTLALNRYNIPEPIISFANMLPPNELDLVITPLVAFDNNGNRLGMGAGYYDRSFEFLQPDQQHKKPSLVGVGFEFQHIAPFKAEKWDVPLHYAATEKKLYEFNR